MKAYERGSSSRPCELRVVVGTKPWALEESRGILTTRRHVRGRPVRSVCDSFVRRVHGGRAEQGSCRLKWLSGVDVGGCGVWDASVRRQRADCKGSRVCRRGQCVDRDRGPARGSAEAEAALCCLTASYYAAQQGRLGQVRAFMPLVRRRVQPRRFRAT